MTDITIEAESQPPIGEVGVVYLGPAAPHWEVRFNFGDPHILEPFRDIFIHLSRIRHSFFADLLNRKNALGFIHLKKKQK